jgi:membrane protease YdiL (CAAX protease family)
MVMMTSLLFAAYHWWSGIGNITVVFLLGIALMLVYRSLNALWPVVVAHYLIDVVAFI